MPTTTTHITDDAIEAAIQQHDDPDHEDALTIEDVRQLLGVVQQDAEMGWSEYMTHIEDGDWAVVADAGDTLVLSTGTRKTYHHDILDRLADDVTDVAYDSVARDVVSAAMHNAAGRLTDYDWSVEYPLVVRKPEGVQDGEQYVLAALAQEIREHGSVAAAVDSFVLEATGHTQSSWADRTGRNQSSVSRNVS